MFKWTKFNEQLSWKKIIPVEERNRIRGEKLHKYRIWCLTHIIYCLSSQKAATVTANIVNQ